MGKDKNAPKKPLTGYFRYTATIRAEVEAETGLKGVKVAPFFSKRWKALDLEKKAEFNAVFQVEMVDYRKKIEEYKTTKEYAEFQAEKATKSYKKKAPKDKNAPKKALSAFFIFSKARRPEATENVVAKTGKKKIGDIGKLLGTWWGEVTSEEKAGYQEQAKKAKTKWEADMKAYKQTPEYEEFREKLAEYKEEKKKAQKKMKREAKKLKEMQAAAEAAAAAEEEGEGSSDEDDEQMEVEDAEEESQGEEEESN